MRKQIFKAIADAVAAVPGVAFVDLWNNQVQTLNGGAAFAFAAVFIEFEAVEWKQQNMCALRGALAVRINVDTRAEPTHGHKDPRILTPPYRISAARISPASCSLPPPPTTITPKLSKMWSAMSAVCRT